MLVHGYGLWSDAFPVDISFECPFREEWRTSRKRRTSGCIRSVCHPTVTTRSRWRLGLRTVCTLNLSITNQSTLIDGFHVVRLVLTMEKIPFEGRNCGKDLLPSCADKDQAHGTLYYPTRDDGVATKPVQRE